MIYKIESLCGYPEKAIVAFAADATGSDPAVDELLSVAVVDADGEQLLSSLVRPERHELWPEAERRCHITPALVRQAPTASEVAEDMRRLLAGERLCVVFDAEHDLDVARACVPQLAATPLSLFSLKNEYAKVHTDVDSMATIAEHYGLDSSYPDTLRRAKALVECFFALMHDRDYVRHIAELLYGAYEPDETNPAADMSDDTPPETSRQQDQESTFAMRQDLTPSNEATDDADKVNGEDIVGNASEVGVPTTQDSERIEQRKKQKPPAKIIIAATITLACVLILCAITFGSGSGSGSGSSSEGARKADVTVSEAGANKTYTFFDSIVVTVPQSWSMETDKEDITCLGGDVGCKALFLKKAFDYGGASDLDADILLGPLLDGLESDGSMTVSRDEMEETKLGKALRYRYPVNICDDTHSYGGYMDVTVSGTDVFIVMLVYPDVSATKVADTVCSWLDGVEYLNTKALVSDEDAWIANEIVDERVVHEFGGLSIEVPKSWRYLEEGSDEDSYMFGNTHDCYGFIGFYPGLTADLESIDEIINDCEERFKESFDTETLNETNISVGEVKGVAFSSTFLNDENKRFEIDLEVLLSGEDMYHVAFWFPEDYSKRLEPIITHAFDSITLKDAEAPIFDGEVRG